MSEPQSVIMIPESGLFTCGTTSWSFSTPTNKAIDLLEPTQSTGSIIRQALAPIILTKIIKDRPDPLFLALRLMSGRSCHSFTFRSNARFVEIYYGDMNATSTEVSELHYLTTSKASPLPAAGATGGVESLYQHSYEVPSAVPLQSSIHFKMLSMRQSNSDSTQCKIEDFVLTLVSSDSSGSPSVPRPPVAATTTTTAAASTNNNNTNGKATMSEEERQRLQEAKQQLQQMKSQLHGTQRAMTSGLMGGSMPPQVPAAGQQNNNNNNNGMIGLIASLALPNSPLQSVITQMQKSMLTDFSKLLDEKMKPVMQRLDQLDAKLQKLSELTTETATAVKDCQSAVLNNSSAVSVDDRIENTRVEEGHQQDVEETFAKSLTLVQASVTDDEEIPATVITTSMNNSVQPTEEVVDNSTSPVEREEQVTEETIAVDQNKEY